MESSNETASASVPDGNSVEKSVVESSCKTPLASVSDGNLVEKFVDWRLSFVIRMRKYRFDRSLSGKKLIEKINNFAKVILQADVKTGLNAQRKENVVKAMHAYEKKLSEGVAILAKMKEEASGGDSVARASSENAEETEGSPDVAGDARGRTESRSDVRSEVVCRRCARCCANYKRCPALGKLCRKCGVFDHYEKTCRKPALASVSDGNLVEKWIDWRESFLTRMREHEFNKSPQGKSMIEKVNAFGRDILRTDRKVGLKAERRREVVELMHKAEFDLCSNAAIVEKEKEKNGAEGEFSRDGSGDADEALAETPEAEHPCPKCGLDCARYKRCPALGKECRRCIRRDHYAKTCTSKVSSSANEYAVYSSAEPAKSPTPASTSDGNLTEKFIEWKHSFRVRMREHGFERSPGGRRALDQIREFGRGILEQDKRTGLKLPRKRMLVDFMRRYEMNLAENVARLGEETADVAPAADSDERGDPRGSGDGGHAGAFLCYNCGFYCADYEWCPAEGKQCRLCHRYGHFARMCTRNKSRYEQRMSYEARKTRMFFRWCPDVSVDIDFDIVDCGFRFLENVNLEDFPF